MKELKATHIIMVYNGEIYEDFETVPCTQLYYRKDEADKVIEEKDAEIARLKAIRKVHVEAIESMGAGLLQDEEENRHSKYKRCLAMAKLCRARYNEWVAYYPTTTTRKMRFLDKWHKRWLTLADKYKEGNV